MIGRANTDYLVARGRVWACQNTKLSASQQLEGNHDHKITRFNVNTKMRLTPAHSDNLREWFASTVLLWPNEPYGIMTLSVLCQLSEHFYDQSNLLSPTCAGGVVRPVGDADLARLALDYLCLITGTFWEEESLLRHF